MSIAIYTLTSQLHDKQSIEAVTNSFLGSLGIDYEFKDDNYADYGSHALDLIYVRTGGTEGILKSLMPDLQAKSHRPFYLLTSGKSNSLAASMEILSYLQQHNIKGEIIHGSPAYIARRIRLLERVGSALQWLDGCRLGVIGVPSDWLISSIADRQQVKERLGIELVDVPMELLLTGTLTSTGTITGTSTGTSTGTRTVIQQALPGATSIYDALKAVVLQQRLQGFTLRCFDLLTAVKNTGCLALAKLNAEGFVAGCEGDVPALLSMTIARALFGISGFQANPSTIDPETGEMLFAHCTIPLNMVSRYELDTHFESGIGIGIRGYMDEGPVTVFKVAGDLSRSFIAEGMLMRCQAEPNLCRTQMVIRLSDKSQVSYFLNAPIGNHHIIIPGHHGDVLKEVLK